MPATSPARDSPAAGGPALAALSVGVDVQELILGVSSGRRRQLLTRAADAGLDYVGVGDHVSFHGGTGFDGLVSATAALTAQDRLGVLVGVYQLALRHPLTVARQLATISQLAPGRLMLGVGVAGEDRSEVANCGVDPASRGRRLDECLQVLRALATGEAVDHDGEFFCLQGAAVRPAAPVPIVVGGKVEAALRRAVRYADGWLGIFVTPRRFTATVHRLGELAVELGRPVPSWLGVNVWCGLDGDPAAARAMLGARMERLYRLPPEKFERVCPAGPPEQVAEWLAPFIGAGAGHVTLIPTAVSWEAGIEAAARVRERLVRHLA
jgi:alkanesulfonate monooxygenase SsuD/methylene tetrahydromethanopterin reductase-like flavin-dependent oxidoreductase (luciferase family)